MNPKAKLSTAQAARYVGVSVSTLKRWRDDRRGPAYVRLEPSRIIRYEVWALDQYIADTRRTVVR
jgi:DNA-binding transcriptional regulator YiaG